MKPPKEHLVITTVALAIAVPNGPIYEDLDKRTTYLNEAIRNHLLGQKVREQTPSSPLLSYAVHGEAICRPDLHVARCKASAMKEALGAVLNPPDPAVDLIKFIVECRVDEVEALLHCWNEGNFDAIRREWPEVPETVFEGLESPEMRARSQARAAEYHAKYPEMYPDQQPKTKRPAAETT